MQRTNSQYPVAHVKASMGLTGLMPTSETYENQIENYLNKWAQTDVCLNFRFFLFLVFITVNP